jgi:DNA adenine methylase
MRPVIRWCGGKRRIVNQILELMPPKINYYYEPFLGGAAVFLALTDAADKQVNESILTDTNADLIGFYNCVANKTKLRQLINVFEGLEARFNVDRETYYVVRSMNPSKMSLPSAAARFYFLNRLCFNGLYRVNKRGQFNVPIDHGRRATIDVDALEGLHDRLKSTRALIARLDFGGMQPAKPGDCVYFDPPYLPVSETAKFCEYTPGGFGLHQQEQLKWLFDRLAGDGVAVIMSQSDTPKTRELYSHHELIELKVNRTVNSDPTKRGKVGELLIYANCG